MKTGIVNVPEKEETFFLSMLKKFRYKAQVLTKEELEDEALAHWSEKGMKSEDVPVEKVFNLLAKHGAKG